MATKISKDELRKEWLVALRSGDYPQTKQALRIPGKGYCCLGVLCEILCEKGVVQRGEDDYLFDTEDEPGILHMATALETPILRMVGLTSDDETCLMKMNDGDEDGDGAKEFIEIADYLETELFA